MTAIRITNLHCQSTALSAALSSRLVSEQVYNYWSVTFDLAPWSSVNLNLNTQPPRIGYHNWQALPIEHSEHGSLSIWHPVSVSTTDPLTHLAAEWRLLLISTERLIF